MTCPCGCGRTLTPEQHTLAELGIQIAWHTRVLDLATQYERLRHPLASLGDTWAPQLLSAAHGAGSTTLPPTNETTGWLDAVQAIINQHRLDLITSRYQPAPTPHSHTARAAHRNRPHSTTRWADLGLPDPTYTPTSRQAPAPKDPVGPTSLGEFLSSDVTIEGLRALIHNLPAADRRKYVLIAGAALFVLLIFAMY